MKKRSVFMVRLMALSLILMMIVSGIMPAEKTYADEKDVTVKLHYHREDNNYDGWDVWFWEYGKDGKATPFMDEDGDKVASVILTPGTTQLGFIVRTESWTKDIDKDQYIDVSEMVSGTVHVYVESKVEGYEKVYGDDAVRGIKLVSAKYEGGNVVTVKLTDNAEQDPAEAFVFAGADGNIGIKSVAKGENYTYTVFLNENLDYFKSYKVTFMDIEYNVIIPSIWSEDFFEKEMTYTGNDLGAAWTKEKTSFRVWAPTAEKLEVLIYEGGTPYTDDKIDTVPMTKDVNGTWICEKAGDLNGKYYVYSVTVNGKTTTACDPYARTTGVNGSRAMIIDLSSTNPEGWEKDKDPNFDMPATDMIIYELHIRDLGTHESSGIQNPGKYISLTETGTKTEGGMSTGLDHIKELGITHLHILPFYDFGSVDETKGSNLFNWGYDPLNYNVPEGSYATDPYNGEVRVKEAKQMVKALHDNGISVVMDVVYNHVQSADGFCFNKLVPGYFSRTNEAGGFSNGSGCGNDTASERSMVKKYIVDSVNYWADEYHIDGFRFDLVGLLDVDTINEIVNTVHEKHPNVKFYGEGWTLTTTVTKKNVELCTQPNSKMVPEFAFFSDNMRDTLKGGVFSTTSKGFVSGSLSATTIMRLFKAQSSWTKNPLQTVNYASCHDNNTLIDRITSSTNGETRENQVRMNNLAAAVYLTAEGIPFMQAGEEMLRTKLNSDGSFNENSYNAGDKVNQLVWSDLDKPEYKKVFEYYKGLIAFRKAHSALRMTDAEMIDANISELPGLVDNTAALMINGGVNGEKAEAIICIFNGNSEATKVDLPEGTWGVCVDADTAGTKVLRKVKGSVEVEPISALILVKGGKNNKLPLAIGAGIAALAVIAAALVFVFKRKKK